MYTILVVGSDARAHALFTCALQSPLAKRVLCTPGNGGIDNKYRRDVKETDYAALIQLAKREAVNFVIISAETPLADGLADMFRMHDIAAFGPSKMAARLEASKIFMKTRCKRWGIPTADFDFAGDYRVAERIIKDTGFRIIKANGLCDGKGVTVADTEGEAPDAAYALLVEKQHGKAGERIVIEEKLEGRECSVMALCDGSNAVLLPPARDYKRAYDGDAGPNTGGMGCFTPVPDVDDALLVEIKERIIMPTLRGMRAWGFPSHGILYAGIMLTKDGPKLLEWNVRFGDPEAQTVLPLIESDIVEYMIAACEFGGLAEMPPPAIKDAASVCRVLASKGYPEKYETGFPIIGTTQHDPNVHIFHAGTERSDRDGNLYSCGGRVLSCVGIGKDIAEARERSRQATEHVQFGNKFHRTDIAADT